MNKRIHEFIEQAMANEPYDCGSSTKQQWLETLVSLVIKECVDVCDWVHHTYSNKIGSTDDTLAAIARDSIKERFKINHE